MNGLATQQRLAAVTETPEQKMERRRKQARDWLKRTGLWCLSQPVERKTVKPSPLMQHKMRMVEARGAK